jgi:hypothetical protein
MAEIPETRFSAGEFKFKGLLTAVAHYLEKNPDKRYSIEDLWTTVALPWTQKENQKRRNLSERVGKGWEEKNRNKIKLAFFTNPLTPFFLDGDRVYYQPFNTNALAFFHQFGLHTHSYQSVFTDTTIATIKQLNEFVKLKKIDLGSGSSGGKKRKREDILHGIFKACCLNTPEQVEKNGFVSANISKDGEGNRVWPVDEILEECVHGKEIFYIVKWAKGGITKVHVSQLEKCEDLLTKFYQTRLANM